MRGPEALDRKVDQLERGTEDLGMAEVYEWLKAVSEQGVEVGRPPEYFGEDEWSETMITHHEMTAQMSEFPYELLTPAETFVIAYMDEETVDMIYDVIAADPPEGFADAVQEFKHKTPEC